MRFAALSLSLLVVAGCSEPWPAEARFTVTNACLTTAPATYCDCYVNELQKRIPTNEMVGIMVTLRNGGTPDAKFSQAIAEASLACRGK